MPAKYPKHSRMLTIARKELGVAEHPMGSNRGQRVEEYQAADWLPGGGYAWCASFCCWVGKAAGFVLTYLGAGAYKWYDEGARHVGRKIPRDEWRLVIPGDWVVFAIGSGHIGIVEKIENGSVTSIDGNTSDRVARRVRSLNQVYGFVHLDEKAVAPPKPPKPPMWEVVGSESGHRVIYVSGPKAIAKRLPRFLKKYPLGITIRRRKKVK